MKINLAVVAVAASLMGASLSANAQLSFTLMQGLADNNGVLVPSNNATGTLSYYGTIINQGSSDITIGGGGIALPNSIGLTDNFTDFTFGDLPITLAPGSFYNLDQFIVLTVPANTAQQSAIYTLADNTTGATIGSATVTFGVPTSAVPEPGAVAMFAGSLISGAMFVARRRK